MAKTDNFLLAQAQCWTRISLLLLSLIFFYPEILRSQRTNVLLLSTQTEFDYCNQLKAVDSSGEMLPESFLFSTLGDVYNYQQSVPSELNPSALIVGANKGSSTGDGATTDPTFNSLVSDSRFSHWNKIFVEPIPSIFAELKKNIIKSGAHNAFAVNAAVMRNESRLTMYCWKLKDDGNINYTAFSSLGLEAFSWMAGTCSLNKQRLFSQYDYSFFSKLTSDQTKALIQEVDVQGRTFTSIMSSLGMSLESVKYLQIDAEGFDAELLQLLPWDNHLFKPALINFETAILSTYELSTVSELLTQAGYMLRDTPPQISIWAFSSCSSCNSSAAVCF
jgi:FkbM family methyltransferase